MERPKDIRATVMIPVELDTELRELIAHHRLSRSTLISELLQYGTARYDEDEELRERLSKAEADERDKRAKRGQDAMAKRWGKEG